MVAYMEENNSSVILSSAEIRTSSNAQINYHVAARKAPGQWGEWMLVAPYALNRLVNSQ